jgi:predicted acylesterase/phospholipase RssA
VCITVSASRTSGGGAQRLLLNHISTPHVTLASAVAASCALPGVMAPAKLMTKNSAGVLEPFEVIVRVVRSVALQIFDPSHMLLLREI